MAKYKRSNWKSSRGGSKMVDQKDGTFKEKGSASRAKRRAEAEERQKRYDKLDYVEKLQQTVLRRGDSNRERVKIQNNI